MEYVLIGILTLIVLKQGFDTAKLKKRNIDLLELRIKSLDEQKRLTADIPTLVKPENVMAEAAVTSKWKYVFDQEDMIMGHTYIKKVFGSGMVDQIERQPQP